MFMLKMSFILRVKLRIFIFHDWQSHYLTKTFEFSFYYIQSSYNLLCHVLAIIVFSGCIADKFIKLCLL